MWSIEPILLWAKEYARFEKKYPQEAAGALTNLERFVSMLNSAPNSKAIQSGFLHTEGKGVLAIDQRGQGKNLRETRLYVYADDESKTVYLITIGNKKTQTKDIALAHDFVDTNFNDERP